MRLTGDVDLAEDAVQEAYVRALRSWSPQDVPRNPAAWLTTTAKRIALNAMAREANLRTKLPQLAARAEEAQVPEGREAVAVPDDRLRLIFTCCHPSLSEPAKLALTLRLVCGIPTPDIARLLLTSESAMAARITRAKKKIRAARIPYEVPATEDLPGRIRAVVAVIYLMYTAGHTAPSGRHLVRVDVTARAIDLARSLRQLMPDAAEVAAVLALMLVTQARAGTRHDREGQLVRLQDQDRSRWDGELIREGLAHLADARARQEGSRYVLEARIAATHATAPRYEDTDWRTIRMLYDALLASHPSPVVALNRAVAISQSDGVEAALGAIESLTADGRLDGYVYLHATRAEFNRQLGRHGDALAAYQTALTLTDNAAEQQYLRERARAVEEAMRP